MYSNDEGERSSGSWAVDKEQGKLPVNSLVKYLKHTVTNICIRTVGFQVYLHRQ